MMHTYAIASRNSPPEMMGPGESTAPSVPSPATEADQGASEAKRQVAREKRQGYEKPAVAARSSSDAAYSIRNYLASIRMRLYSLGRLNLPADQQDDLDVIADEMGNIEDIVRSFLELARPVKCEEKKLSIRQQVLESRR